MSQKSNGDIIIKFGIGTALLSTICLSIIHILFVSRKSNNGAKLCPFKILQKTIGGILK